MIKYLYCFVIIGIIFSSCKVLPESELTIKYSLNSNWVSQIDTISIDNGADSLKLLFDIVANNKNNLNSPKKRDISDYSNLKYVKAGTYKYTFQNGIRIEITNRAILPHGQNYYLCAYKNKTKIWTKKLDYGFNCVLFGSSNTDYLYSIDYAGRFNVIDLITGKLKYLVVIDNGFSYMQADKALKYGDYVLIYGNNRVINRDLYGDYDFHYIQEKIYIIELNE